MTQFFSPRQAKSTALLLFSLVFVKYGCSSELWPQMMPSNTVLSGHYQANTALSGHCHRTAKLKVCILQLSQVTIESLTLTSCSLSIPGGKQLSFCSTYGTQHPFLVYYKLSICYECSFDRLGTFLLSMYCKKWFAYYWGHSFQR